MTEDNRRDNRETEGAGWFNEPPQAGQQLFLQVEAQLHESRSRYQRIQVLETALFGRALVLDGILQTTEKDEFFYHEMLVHPAMLSHPQPESVLIIGGGDGGALRRALEHNPRRVTMVEIDREVVEVSRRYLPEVSAGAFDDPRNDMRFEDGYAFVESTSQRFDVIIVDAPDPIGPGKQLWAPEFYGRLRAILNDGGIVAAQSESPLLMATQMAATHLSLRSVFPLVRTYLGLVPSYPGAAWSFTIAYKPPINEPHEEELRRRLLGRRITTAYYTPGVHSAAFHLPVYLDHFLRKSLEHGEPADDHPFFPLAQGITVTEPPS